MENIKNSQLKEKVMKRVHLIFFCRKYFFNMLSLKIYFSIALVIGLISRVSVVDVLSNMFRAGGMDMGSISYFSKYALMHTEITVQAILVLATLFVLLNLVPLIRSYIPSIRSTHTF